MHQLLPTARPKMLRALEKPAAVHPVNSAVKAQCCTFDSIRRQSFSDGAAMHYVVLPVRFSNLDPCTMKPIQSPYMPASS